VEGGYLTAALHGQPLGPHVQRTSFPNLSVLPSSAELSQLSLIQEVERRGMGAFRKAARDIAAGFDAVFVDCPPSLAGLPHMALSVSDWVLIPVQCEYYAMEGLSQIMPIIYDVQKGNNKELRVIGLLLTMFSEELELSHDVLREVKGYFPDAVFDTVIPRDVVLAEAASHGLPAFEYAPLSRGAWSYVELAKELIRHG
jgi:chromosome partitioning protein